MPGVGRVDLDAEIGFVGRGHIVQHRTGGQNQAVPGLVLRFAGGQPVEHGFQQIDGNGHRQKLADIGLGEKEHVKAATAPTHL